MPEPALPRTRQQSFEMGYMMAEHDIRTDLSEAITAVETELMPAFISQEAREGLHKLRRFRDDS